MAYFVLMLGVGIIGLIYLAKGEYKITKNKVVDAKTGRALGAIMLIAAVVDYISMNSMGGVLFLSLIALIIAVVVGLTRGKPVNQ